MFHNGQWKCKTLIFENSIIFDFFVRFGFENPLLLDVPKTIKKNNNNKNMFFAIVS